MDDFLVFGNDKEHLAYLKERISGFLADKLKLRLHEKKSTIFSTKDGVNFLGFRIFRDYRRLMKENVKRFIKRMKRMAFEYRMGLPRPPMDIGGLAMTPSGVCHCEADVHRLKQSGTKCHPERSEGSRNLSRDSSATPQNDALRHITNSVQSWIAHARYGNTYNLRKKILPRINLWSA